MGRNSKLRELVETTVGQHLSLSVAAHLARTQLVPDPLNAYDTEHLLASVDAIANALLRVTTLYVRNTENGEPRRLTEAELDGATVKKAARHLVLKDGRVFSAISVKRADLRQAIAILKAVGVPELTGRAVQRQNALPKDEPPSRMVALAAKLKELEGALSLPLVPERVERANRLAVSIARMAPQGRIANLAMLLMSAVHEARNGGDQQSVHLMLGRLSSAVGHEASAADERESARRDL